MEKIKYLDMENATLKIQLRSIRKYKNFFKKNYSDLLEMNFKRIHIKIQQRQLNETINVLQQFNLQLIIEVNLNKDLTLPIPDNFLVINTNSNFQIIRSNLYNKVVLNSKNLSKIVDLINKDINTIIEPQINIKDISEFNKCLNQLFEMVPNRLLNLGNFIIPTNLLKEHPCNCYLCDGWKCHKKISRLPKVILIDGEYNLYPHMLTNNKLHIGNIKNDTFQNLIFNYLHSKEYDNFINCCKKVFVEYLPNYPFQYFPVAEYIKEVANGMQ